MRPQKPIAISEAPAILSKWRHLRRTGIVSDRELWGALNACVEELNARGAFDAEGQAAAWQARVVK